ncbi:MAG: histidine phosphatase family protein, partial [Anaerolineae bacterium]|nr:histidine phosphatase family protein [Anaerolineae bacterium]
AAQARGVAVLEACHLNHGGEHIVLGTHGNLLALVLQHFDPTVDFEFWLALTMPDIYRVRTSATGEAHIEHLWLPELASS